MYEQTLAAYERLLGESPPHDIWPAAVQRFGEDLQHVMVNTARNWIVPKPRIASTIMETWGRSQRTPLIGAALIVFPLAAVTWNPLDWKGPQFLACYLTVMAAAAAVAFVARLVLGLHEDSSKTGAHSPLSSYEVACLAGGPARAVQAAFVSMAHAGTLRIDAEAKRILGIFPSKAGMIHQGIAPSANAPELEKAIYDAASVPLADATRLFTTGLPAAEEIRERLVARGLMQPRLPSLDCVTAAIIMVSPLILGVPKIIVGLSRGKPVEYLLIACVATLVAAAMFLFARSRLTKSGKAILENLRVKHSAVKDIAGDAAALLKPTELALAIGLFGAAMLATGPLSSAYAMLPRTPNGSNASSGCSGGGCGAGGCGGGCGGCGS